MKMTMFHQNLRSFVIFWWTTVIFIFWWSMVASQILVEHGRFWNFGGTQSFLFFWWSMVVFQILVKHGCFSSFGGAWSSSTKKQKWLCHTKLWQMTAFHPTDQEWPCSTKLRKRLLILPAHSLPDRWKFKKMNTSIYRRFYVIFPKFHVRLWSFVEKPNSFFLRFL